MVTRTIKEVSCKGRLISVVLPVYNGSRYLEKSIDSVLSQSLKDFELLILDDCSTDESKEIIRKYSDQRIKLYKNVVNQGIFFSINKLIKQSSAPYIHLWAQDDIMEHNCLEECFLFHERNPDVAFSFSSNYRINEDDEIVRKGPDNGKWIVVSPEDSIALFIAFGCIPSNISSVTLKREVIVFEGLFREDLQFVGDFEMWVRLSAKYPFGKISSRLVKIRNHEGQASRNPEMLIKKLAETIEIHKKQIELLSDAKKKSGKRIINWIHQPHFAYVALRFFRTGNLYKGFQYLRHLQKMGRLPLLLSRSFILSIINLFQLKEQLKNHIYRPFKSSIDKFY